MSRKDISIAVIDIVHEMNDSRIDTVERLSKQFTGDASNSATNDLFNIYANMLDHLVLSALHTQIKKEFNESKKQLDSSLAAAGMDNKAVEGQNTVLFKHSHMEFRKKQNQAGTNTLLTDFITALNRLGVDKSVIDSAISMATKPKKGNTYYIVEAVD